MAQARVWIFQGENTSHAAAIYSDFQTALRWIETLRLTGILTEYPVDSGVYDWAVARRHFTPRQKVEPSFIASFTSASQRHLHFERGKLIEPPPQVGKPSVFTTRVWVFAGDRGRFPGGIFSTEEKALDWARTHRLTGTLQPYPLNMSLFEWMRRRLPKDRRTQRKAEIVANYWSSTPEDIRVVDGSPLPGSRAANVAQPSPPSRVPPPVLIAPADITLWASRTEARAQLPVLVMRLIMTGRSRIHRLEFPGGESVDRPGWDGIVLAEGNDPFVPSGTSGWEISVESAVIRKLDRDYTKRSQNPEGLNPKTSTLVLVSARRSAAARTWARDRASDGVWADVRVYTADDLAVWINAVTPVAMWFAGLIGKIPPGVASLESWWTEWSIVTGPSTSADLVLAGLSEATSLLQQWTVAPAAALVVRAATRDEAIAVLAAAATRGDVDQSTLGRTWIANSPDTFAGLAAASSPLVLVANFDDRSRVTMAVAAGHHVYVPSDDADPTAPTGLEVTKRDRAAAEQALQDMGLDSERAALLAETARLSLSAVRRRLAAVPLVAAPLWAKPEGAAGLPGPMLVGSWDESRESDRQAVEHVAGMPYEAVDAMLRRWSSAPDSPVALVANIWRFVDSVDAWMLLHKHVGSLLLDRFEEVAVNVLGESDPRYDLPVEEQYAAAVYGKTLNHSDRVRKSIASVLALIAALSESHPIPGARSGQEIATRVVARLLEHADARRWASLSTLLPLLAEAAPDAFLRRVDEALTRTDIMSQLFTDASASWTVSSPHTGLLWALEVLAWRSEYLSEAIDALAQLGMIDLPGGRLSKRPTGSIAEILKVWHPSTCANLRDRLAVGRHLAVRFPQIAWNALMATLPMHLGVAHETAHAQWRDWRCPSMVTYSDVSIAVTDVVDILLTLAGDDVRHWLELVQLIDDLSEPDRKRVLAALEEAGGNLDAAERASVWNALRELVDRHREFPDARWALPAAAISDIEQVVEALAPQDITLSSAWLFTDHPKPPNFRQMSWDEQVNEARRRRLEMVRRLYTGGGMHEVIEFARRVAAPWTVGEALANIAPLSELAPLIEVEIDGGEPRSLSFARGIVYELVRSRPQELQSALDGAKSNAARAEILAALPFDQSTWSRVAREPESIQTLYWTRLSLHGRGAIDPAQLEYVAQELIEFRHLSKAIDFVHLYSDIASAELIVRVLRAPLVANAELVLDVGNLATDIARLLAKLADAAIEIDTLAELEWNYLPLLHEPLHEPRALVDRLHRDPAFFVEVLGLAYRARGQDVGPEPTDQARELAHRAFSLLHGWKRPPGVTGDQVDREGLWNWVNDARHLATQQRRLEVADVHIGQVLAYLPDESAGSWPRLILGDLLEDLRSNEVESGLLTGVLNKRGVVTKGFREGGQKEWELSDQFAERALALAPRYPRLARVLRRIAESYETMAKREDAEAELGL